MKNAMCVSDRSGSLPQAKGACARNEEATAGSHRRRSASP